MRLTRDSGIMKLLVDRITPTPTPHHFESGANWWQERMPSARRVSFAAVEPFQLDFSAHSMGPDLYLEGSMSGAIEVECSRCLARYRHPLRDAFRLVLEPAGERVPAEPEGAAALERDGMCLGDELESGWYRGRELHLDTFFAEVIALTLPVQPVCREACAGLCPRCGVDRNHTQCDCESSVTKSPFAVLASLRAGGDGEESGQKGSS